jgi:hypothetical protein
MKRYTSLDSEYEPLPDANGEWVKHSDHEAALAAAVAKEREMSAGEFEEFSRAILHQCRGRIGELVANMAIDRAAAIRARSDK